MKRYYERYWDDKTELGDLHIKWPNVMAFFPPNATGKVMDYGCGKGVLLKRIRELHPGLTIYGLDVSKQAIREIKKEFKRGTFKTVEDGDTLPFRSNTFDYVLATDVLEHVYDTEKIFQELTRVLQPGGTMLITVPYHGMLKNILATLIAFDAYFEPKQPHIRFYTRKNLKNCIHQVGLEIYKFGYYGRIYPLSHAMYAYCKKP